MDFQNLAIMSLLYDFYGELLSPRQKEVLSLYYEENLSLGEIAEEFNISRQGVHDALKHGDAALAKYETKLGLVKRFTEQKKSIARIREILALINNKTENLDRGELTESIARIREIVDGMNA